MENTNENIGFKKFIEQHSTLISVFGVLNAFILYASKELQGEWAQWFIIGPLYVISILIWFEVLWSAAGSSNNWKIKLFYFLACMVEIGITYYFFQLCELFWQSILAAFFAMAVMVFIVLPFYIPLAFVANQFSAKLSSKNYERLKKLLLLISFGLATLLLRYAAENNFLKNDSGTTVTDSTNVNQSKDTIQFKVKADVKNAP
jgi:hypothetical protein